MDPVTQGAVGAAFGQTFARPRQLAKAACIAAVAGMAPDLDVLIKSNVDPLLAIEFHRHFTHSLFFIPVGALACSFVMYALVGRRWMLSFRVVFFWSLIGYATHALLDGCTSYGTQLLWPLSNRRFAWDTISVIDPLFTLPLLIAVIIAAWRRQRKYILAGVAWAMLYLAIGFVQHSRALAIGTELAKSRGHSPSRMEVKPSFANIAVWKLIYEFDGRFYVTAVKPGLTKQRVWQGESVPKLDVARDLPWVTMQSQQAIDIERFRWFSMDYLALDQNDPRRVVDIRYSMLPDQIKPLWGIELSQQATDTDHVKYVVDRSDSSNAVGKLVDMIFD